jgi:L-iditol 2-dehydrogenase
MKALIKKQSGWLGLIDRKEPALIAEGDVLLRIQSVGLCRTDLFVANGVIKVDQDIVLGHECSGIVEESLSPLFKKGDFVGLNPLYDDAVFMGLHFDGALCEKLIVPAKQLILAPRTITSEALAYLEPVAASMAVLKAPIKKKMKGAVWGENRIAELTYIILQSKGFDIQRIDHKSQILKNTFDYIIETEFEEAALSKMCQALKFGGLLVVKSRKSQLVGINASVLVGKELTLKSVNYASFEGALSWLVKNEKKVEHLLGDVFPLEKWEDAFSKAQVAEARKIFIRIGE